MEAFEQLPVPREVIRLDQGARRLITSAGTRMPTMWRVWGNGPPICLLHGGHGTWLHWFASIDELARDHTVFAADMPGFGDSSGAQPESIEDIARSVAQGIIEIAADRPVVLLGFSLGGIVAGLVARLIPDRLVQMIIVGAGALGLPRQPPAELFRWRNLSDGERREAHRRNLELLMFKEPDRINDVTLWIQMQNTSQARWRHRGAIKNDLLSKALIAVPQIQVDGIWGDHDAIARGFLRDRHQFLTDVNPRWRYVEVADAGHWVMQERPDAFNKVLLLLLQGGSVQ